jgi:catechol 2,3-dioxygenase-like lactoylglutathione lyase family enzyme
MRKAKILALTLLAMTGGHTVSAQTTLSNDPTAVRVRYIVNDVPKAVEFYTQQLGFTLEMQGGPHFAALSRSGTVLLLSPVTGPGGASQAVSDGTHPAAGGGWARLVFYTPNLQADVDRLRKAGGQFP